ncbi:MAG: hypothetical protein A2527_01780 [Candidatus Lambdaproteobacteria bacterium RIFOXYD2_FULL_50_16]|uniref:Inner membrane protein YgaP-like transmembrane domain-containing protein n=1 Tax=Candidatus Lambdaproteobacteria bacterium RIFOXYD2_FULL_50_16 TaxID=1817772 RepID=A0A1F6GE96_9PROT|nr:MAG: hypothetical protein A2527_01780 [Candidatus Lambdaproteobacteria bacterium RIFOXYD2_FULL_50_16]
MCVERIHRFLIASVLGVGAYLISLAMPEGQYILWFVIGMLTLYGLTNFCPSVWILRKLGLKSCTP